MLVGFDTLLIKPIDGYEYSLDGEYWFEGNYFEVLDGEYYTVYQRPIDSDDLNVFNNSYTTVFTNGNNPIFKPDAESLVWLREILLSDLRNNLAADFNGDFEVDIRDLVRIKKNIAEIADEEDKKDTLNTILNNAYLLKSLKPDGNLYCYLIYFADDGICGVTHQAMEETTDTTDYSLIHNGKYYATYNGFGTEMNYSVDGKAIFVSGMSDGESNGFKLELNSNNNLTIVELDEYWDSMDGFDAEGIFEKD